MKQDADGARKDVVMERMVARVVAAERRHSGAQAVVNTIAKRITASARRNDLNISTKCATRLAVDLAPVVLRLPYENRPQNPENSADKWMLTLTMREKQVVIGLALGLTSVEMAARLGVSEHTVKSRRDSAYKTMGVSTSAQAVAVAIKYGLITAADISDV